jgi:hypothetical protein
MEIDTRLGRHFESAQYFRSNMMSRLGMVVGVLVLVTAFLFYPVSCPSSDKRQKSKLLFCARMAEGEEFVLSFIHSVNKRPVYDTIRVDGTISSS